MGQFYQQQNPLISYISKTVLCYESCIAYILYAFGPVSERNVLYFGCQGYQGPPGPRGEPGLDGCNGTQVGHMTLQNFIFSVTFVFQLC